MKNKKGFEFSFSWFFAILAGAVILFLAIYAAVKIIGTSRETIDTASAKQLTIIFEPLETGAASGLILIPKPISLREETKIYNTCQDSGNFGKQGISLASKSGFGRNFQNPGVEIEIKNKYIFSNDTEQGKIVYYFALPLNLPWKISDLIFLTSKKYCFVNAPDFVKEEISELDNVLFENCTGKETEVCFNSDCEISVYGTCGGDCETEYDYGYVSNNNEVMYYVSNLMYGAIFSSKEIYECNIKRLMKRTMQQALILKEEANFIADKCSSVPGLIEMVAIARELNSSRELINVNNKAKSLKMQNEAAECQLW